MRRARPLFLLAIAGIAGYLAFIYRERLIAIDRQKPIPPVALPHGVHANAKDGWDWEKSSENGPKVQVHAKNFRQVEEPNRFELEGIELKIFRRDGKTFDKIVSDKAIFDMAEAYLYSEGEADITMGVADGEEPAANRLVRIKSTGIRFDSKTGKAETERAVTFTTARGEGKAVGAVYDPQNKQLRLRSQAQLLWQNPESKGPPMKVESNELLYLEGESKVLLSPWAKLTRAGMTLEGKGAIVQLDKEAIRQVDTTEAKGIDKTLGRTLEYSANTLKMNLSEKSQVEKIDASGNAHMVTTTEQAVTTTNAEKVEMSFEAAAKETVLRRVLASGNAEVESKPLARPNVPVPETKVLRSAVVELKMRDNGREIETMDTPSAAVLEFFPNRAGQHKRRVEGEQFHVEYGPRNQVDTFRVTKAATRTENDPKQGKPQPPSLTWSRELTALFAPKTGEMTRMEQSGDFRYEEGDRRARSERALLDQASGRITLIQGARVSDATGSTAADQIILDQKSEDFVAQGNVTSSRLPDKKGSGSAMMSKDEPMQAKAARMNTYERQSLVIYEGNAMLWQAASRIQGDKIEIDRKNSQLRANGKVVTQVQDQAKKTEGKKATMPTFTLITSPSMIYYDKERLAHYTGGAFLRRDLLDVKAREIRAFLTPEQKPAPAEDPKAVAAKADDGTSLDHAVADGNVIIVQAANNRTRKGNSGYADYVVKENKIVMERGASGSEKDDPVFEDSVKGVTRGRQLIYYSDDDRLLVSGAPSQPAASKLRRKK
ncbi:MAG: LPS export ABC transporter periplasmic protein LptC [Acidobacteria bacterium]|nr:LPS export ABC transporter periplasmic protein LptC [Acidobacteriota bacterium]